MSTLPPIAEVEPQPFTRDFVEVKPNTAKAYMAVEAKRGVAPKTWNDILKLLRATFKHLHPHLNEGSNPFHEIVTKATETVNREPFTVEELKAVTEACADDDFLRPVIVTGHRTVEVVMKHYFRPGREDFRQAIMRAMPKMLANAAPHRSVKEEMREILESSTAKSWRQDRKRLLGLVSQV